MIGKWRSFWPSLSEASREDETTRSVVLMTDGEFNWAYVGGEDDADMTATSEAYASNLCTNMKADGILVYAVAFQAPESAESPPG